MPASIAPPSISGTLLPDAVLTETHGAWNWDPTQYAYQWLRCNAAGALCAAIPGATAQTFTLTAGDVGATLRVQEVASNAFGSGSPATSPPTGVVGARPLGARVRGSYLFYSHGRTRITKLFVGPLPAGTTVVVTCKSPRRARRASRCPFKHHRIAVRRAKRKQQLAKYFKQRKLARGTRIGIRATKPGTIGLAARLTTRRLKVPAKRLRCLPPGASKPVKC